MQIDNPALRPTNNLSDVADAATARDNLGVSQSTGGNGTATPSGLVTGGGVFYEAGALTFRVSAATYYINGTLYTSAEQTVTLTAADATNPRIDVLVLNTSSLLDKVTGTAAAAPSEPDYDPATQIKLTFVYVPALATELTGITDLDIYLDNAEWTTSTSGSGFNANSTNNPYSGTKCIEGTAVANGAYVSLDRGAPASIDSYQIFSMFVRSKAAWASGRVLRAQWYAEGVAKGQAVTIASGYWGFNSSITGSYQLIVIPMAQFIIPAGTLIDQLRISDVGGSIGFYLDNLVLQAQGTTVSTPIGGITQAQADARYPQLINEATAAQYRANTADKYLTTDPVWSAAGYVTLNDSGGNIAVDMSLGFNFSMTMDGDYTLSNPTNTKDGQTGCIVLTQDGTGTQTLAYGTNWKFAGGSDPVLSTAAGTVDVLFYQVLSSTSILGNLVKAIA